MVTDQMTLFPNLHPHFPTVVGITSKAPRSGKSTMADVLVNEYGYVRVKFAKYLKEMVSSILQNLGYSEVLAENWIENRKDEVLPDLGVTLRHMMETLGTDWGRTMIRDDLWIVLWRNEVKRHLKAGSRVVVDDMRFLNEASEVSAIAGSALWCVIRSSAVVPPRAGKQVEGIIDPNACTEIIHNDSTIATLQWWVRNKMENR